VLYPIDVNTTAINTSSSPIPHTASTIFGNVLRNPGELVFTS
jgi:hypothetical protein